MHLGSCLHISYSETKNVAISFDTVALVIQIKEITLMLGDVQDLTSEMDDDDGNFWEMHVIVFGDGSEFKPRATCVQQFTSKGLCTCATF